MHQRHQQLLNFLDADGELSVQNLADRLGASEATIRRDLQALQDQQKLTRTLGGAKRYEGDSLVRRTFEGKRERMRAEKEAIACAAAKLVEPGMSLAIDSGTTTWRLAIQLRKMSGLTIFTTALPVIEELGANDEHLVHLTGGTFRLENLDFVGPNAVRGFESLHADIAFISVDSIRPGLGAFSLDEESAAVSAAMAAQASRTVLLADHTKVYGEGAHRTLTRDQIDLLIMDAGASAETRTALQAEPFDLEWVTSPSLKRS